MESFNSLAIDYDSAASCRPLSLVPWATEFPPIDPFWRTETVLSLAEAIRETKDHSRLLILADALEDSGCADPFVLDHCRLCEHHDSECWLVSAVLKSPDDIDSLRSTERSENRSNSEETTLGDGFENILFSALSFFDPLDKLFEKYGMIYFAAVLVACIGWGLVILVHSIF